MIHPVVVGCMVTMLIGCLAGCARGPRAVDVSGTVTFAGKPLPAGHIYFNPDFSRGNDGPQGFAEIRAGKFDTRVGGAGATGGPMIVVIQGYDGTPGETPGWMGNPLFKEHQMPADLPRESCTRDFEVPASAAKDLPKPHKGKKP